GIRSDAAHDGNPLRADRSGSLVCALDECAHDRALIARGEIDTTPLELVRGQIANRVEQRGLESRERKVETGNARDRKRVRRGIAVARERVDRSPAGIAEAEQPRALV